MNLAIVHDWLSVFAGAEQCLLSFRHIWPDSDVYALIDYLSDDDRQTLLGGEYARTSLIQGLPFSKRAYRSYLPFFPFAVEQFDLGNYDVILSSSHAVAKGVLTRHDQLHISYVHSPIRYAWDLYHQYLRESGLDRGIKGWIARWFLHYIRNWDVSTAHRPDYYIANSHFIAERIRKTYNKSADTIYPPVDVDKFTLQSEKQDYYLTASRFVPYKKIDLIVETFAKIEKQLVVVGDGPDAAKIKALGAPNIEFKGYVPRQELISLMQGAKAFVFAAVEDFGIVPVEAQACGTPVIALGQGGSCETVRGPYADDPDAFTQSQTAPTGVLFRRQTVADLTKAVQVFDAHQSAFDPHATRAHAETFSRPRFEQEITEYVAEKLKTHSFLGGSGGA